MRRVMPEAGGVVAVLVPAGDAIDALPRQIELVVLYAARIPHVRQRGRQRFGAAEPIVEQAEQDRARVAAAVRPIEPRHEWLHERTIEQDVSGHALLAHQKASAR